MASQFNTYQAVVVSTQGMTIKVKTPHYGGEDDTFIPPLVCNDRFHFAVPEAGTTVLVFDDDNGQARYYLPISEDAKSVSDTGFTVIGKAASAQKALKGEDANAVLDKIFGYLDQLATNVLDVNTAIPSLAPDPATATAIQALKLQIAADKAQLSKLLSEALKNA